MTVKYIGFGYDKSYQQSLDGKYCLFNGAYYVHPCDTKERAEKVCRQIMGDESTHIARMTYDETTGRARPVEAYVVGGEVEL